MNAAGRMALIRFSTLTQKPRNGGVRKLDIVFGTITHVAAGASVDGVAQATVTDDNGDAFDAMYPTTYTPTVNDIVCVLLIDNAPLILGAFHGIPTF